MTETAQIRERPLSPHLQVYRLPMTAKMSISHRITGILLTLGLIVLSAWFIAAASGEDIYNQAMALIDTPLTFFIFMAWAFILFYHMGNGIRHLFWDMVIGVNQGAARITGVLVILFAVIATGGLWFAASQQDEAPTEQVASQGEGIANEQ